MKYLRVAALLAFFTSFAFAAASCGTDEDPSGDAAEDPSGDAAAGGTRPSLIGPWELVSATVDGEALAVPSETVFDLVIERGVIEGNGGCNRFSGRIDADDDGTAVISDAAITEMACEPLSLLDFESVYVSALTKTERWEVMPDGLTLSADGTELVYRLAAVDTPEPAALEGTTWQLDSIYAGEGVERTASTPDLSLAPATLTIADGMATIAADGCEPVSIAFAVDDPAASEGSVVAGALPDGTEVCAGVASNMAPAIDGIVEATGFMIVGDRLTLIGLPGETVGFVAA